MPCRIYLRGDQTISQRAFFDSNKVCIFAPLWVKEALKILGKHLKDVKFELFNNITETRASEVVETFQISEDFNGQSLKLLQKIARNEAANVTGLINTSLYSDITDIGVLYSLRDLVRQCVIAGVDNCHRCGGYKCPHETQTKRRVYVCDLAALQFQKPYNTGRLILIQEYGQYKGILDDLIYENVVGEKMRSYKDIKEAWKSGDQETKQRYIPHDGFGIAGGMSCFFDTRAYRKFVELDVVISGLAFSKVVIENDKLLFKFLKYGSGFFAWKFQPLIERQILPGVLDGIERMFGMNDPKVSETIKCIELPFFKRDPQSDQRIVQLKSKYKIDIIFSTNDALKELPFYKKQFIVATTNCGDNHAVCGNEMGFSSVDASIAENLESKGNFFCPNINQSIKEEYIDV